MEKNKQQTEDLEFNKPLEQQGEITEAFEEKTIGLWNQLDIVTTVLRHHQLTVALKVMKYSFSILRDSLISLKTQNK